MIDYVGGRADLAARVVRAIGNPFERFAEDKLRLLRAVRFASTFDFQLDADTAAAVRQEAASITIVSAERIAAELRKILVPASRRGEWHCCASWDLLAAVLPESHALFPHDRTRPTRPARPPRQAGGPRRSACSTRCTNRRFAWHWPPCCGAFTRRILEPPQQVAGIGDRWRLSNHEADGAAWLLTHEPLLRRAATLPWPVLQRILIAEMIDELLWLADAIAREVDGHVRDIDYCRAKLQMPREVLNPPMLISGDDLRAAGYLAGPRFRDVLTRIRDAQLESQIASREEALELARTCSGPHRSGLADSRIAQH